MRDVDDCCIDLILCDLPYGVTKNKWDAMIPFEPLWESYERIIKPNGAIVLFGQDKFTARLMLSNEKLHRYNIIWKKVLKSGFLNANRMPLREHEDIMVFYKSHPIYNPQMVKGSLSHSRGKSVGEDSSGVFNNRVYGSFKVARFTGDMKYPSSVWEFSKPHPSVAISSTEKPVDLLRYIIRTYTNEGMLVLDNCCGSGSTLVAAKLENRNYIGMDNGYCDNKKSIYFGKSWAEVSSIRLSELGDG